MFNVFCFSKTGNILYMCFLFPEYPVTFLTIKGGEKEREYVREGLIKDTGA